MDTLRAQAARAGIETEHYDGLGRHCVAKPEVLSRVLDILGAGEAHAPILPPLVALRQDGGASLTLDAPAGCRIRWEIHAQGATLRGEAEAPCLPLPGDLPVGTWDLAVTLAGLQGERHGRAALLVSPPQAFQGAPEAPRRTWALAVQLYGVRSHTNWGHGDFTDLRRLVELAGALGASGIGLNPLHALFDERPQEPSPYAPNSRFFLNTLYIDVAAIPEFPGLSAALQAEVAALRERELVDHGGVAAA